jgi:hypothetical protein
MSSIRCEPLTRLRLTMSFSQAANSMARPVARTVWTMSSADSDCSRSRPSARHSSGTQWTGTSRPRSERPSAAEKLSPSRCPKGACPRPGAGDPSQDTNAHAYGVNGTVKFPGSDKVKFLTLRFGFSVGLSGASIFRWASATPGLDGRRWCNKGVGPDVLGQQIGMSTQAVTRAVDRASHFLSRASFSDNSG